MTFQCFEISVDHRVVLSFADLAGDPRDRRQIASDENPTTTSSSTPITTTKISEGNPGISHDIFKRHSSPPEKLCLTPDDENEVTAAGGYELGLTFKRGQEELILCGRTQSDWLSTYISDGNELRLRFRLKLPTGMVRLEENKAREMFALPLKIKYKTGKVQYRTAK